ncbi:MAG: transcriptional regulator, AraC family, partial [Modestobacter sp.]|nr:transcriptional regulator, AraC family [Modestobacter sp.]
ADSAHEVARRIEGLAEGDYIGCRCRGTSRASGTISQVTSSPAAAQPLDVEALAGGAHMSAGHLSREFRLAYGELPYAYLMTRRIEGATAQVCRGGCPAGRWATQVRPHPVSAGVSVGAWGRATLAARPSRLAELFQGGLQERPLN